MLSDSPLLGKLKGLPEFDKHLDTIKQAGKTKSTACSTDLSDSLKLKWSMFFHTWKIRV